MKIYLDMDGVLADFDQGYERHFGVRPCKILDNVDWEAVRSIPGFYENLPAMADMRLLYDYVEHLRPTVLTGVPKDVPEAPRNKIAWVRKHLGEKVPVICCASREKSMYAGPGTVLVDDWEKYRHLWLAKGGRWVTHRSAVESVRQLREMGI